MKVWSAVLVTLGIVQALCGAVEGPFELPKRFQQRQFPQVRIGNCSLPFPGMEAKSNRSGNRTFKAGSLTVRILPNDRLRVEGRDANGAAWSLEVSNQPAGCNLYRADLDRNGREDLIIVTADATSSGGGDVTVTLVMIDGSGRPVPWQAIGYFEPGQRGLGNLVDLDRDERAELLYLHVEGYDRGKATSISLARYEIKDARLKRVDGSFAGERFPIMLPKGAKAKQEPDLTNATDANATRVTISELIPGKKEACGQLPMFRAPDGAIKADSARADALREVCEDRLVLSDGRRVNFPKIVVLDRADIRAVAILDSERLLSDIKERRLLVWVVGHSCDYGCRPFLLWASESSR